MPISTFKARQLAAALLLAATVLAVTAIVFAAWWWLGQAVQMPSSPLAGGERLYCVSYAPFRDRQTPLEAATRIAPEQMDQDLAQLARLSRCVRSYSIEHGLDRIAEIAARHRLKVIQGLWLSSHADKNREQIEGVIALAKRHPDVMEAIVVGNEVLLRGEMSSTELAKTIREVKSRVSVPVTYADVWEFWLRNRELAEQVDFITVHILPYWEDFPIPARNAAAHVDAIRARVATEFPGKDVFVGEIGWPSAGRMREGALPSPVNQARVLHDVLATAKARNYRVNFIEAYDQPWKRRLEGTVGGHWGLIDAYDREMKFAWGGAVSNHPAWRWQAAGGGLFAAFVFAVAFAVRRSGQNAPGPAHWSGIAAIAATAGVLVPWSIESVPLESLGIGGWAYALAFAVIAAIAPPLGAAALATGTAIPAFSHVLGRAASRPRQPIAFGLGLAVVALTALSIVAALGLCFDPRYRDFPYAPITAAAAPILALAVLRPRPAGPRGNAETVAAAILAIAAVYVALNEGLANWQALWFAAILVVLALSLLRVRDARG